MSPIVVLSLSFVCGIGVGMCFPTAPWAFILVAFLGLGLQIVSVVLGRLVTVVSISVVFTLGWARPEVGSSLSESSPLPMCLRVVEARVTKIQYLPEGMTKVGLDLERASDCISKLTAPRLRPLSGRVYLRVWSGDPLQLYRGDLVWVRTTLKPIASHRNPPALSSPPRVPLYSAKVNTTREIVRAEADTTFRFFERKRASLASFWHSALPSSEASLACALTLGQTGGLPFAAKESFRQTGTAHLLSVSGLHLGLAIFFAFSIIRWFLLRIYSLSSRIDVSKIAALLSVPVAIAFALLTGCRVPVLRACIMAVTALLAIAFGRGKGRMTESFALAGAALLGYKPDLLFSVGFQLSFLAVTAFFFIREKSQRKTDMARCHTILRGAIGILRSSAAACAVTTPLVLYHFGYVSLIAIPTNLVAIPLTGFFILPGLLLVILIAGSLSGLATLLAKPFGALLGLLLAFLSRLSSWNCTLIYPGTMMAGAVVICSLGVLLMAAKRMRHGLSIFALGMVIAAISHIILPRIFPSHKLTIDFLDVGHGDSTLLTLPDGTHLLIDAGGAWSDSFDIGERIVVPTLRALGVRQLEKLVLTHPDFDHVGGMPAVLKAFETKEIWDNGQGRAEGLQGSYAQLLDLALKRRVPILETPKLCQTFRFGEVRLTIVHPCLSGKSYYASFSTNNNSIVLIVEYGEVRIGLTGDIEERAEMRLLEEGSFGHLDVLKAAHHGSNSSSSEPFLQATLPDYVVISSGWKQNRGAPSREVQRRFDKYATRLFRTDKVGSVRLVTDGRYLEIGPYYQSGSKHDTDIE